MNADSRPQYPRVSKTHLHPLPYPYQICLLLTLLIACTSSERALRRSGTTAQSEYEAIAAQVDSVRIDQGIRKMAAFGSRVIGYAGGDSAAAFIAQEFRDAGLQFVEYESFIGASPIDEGASIRLLSSGETLTVYCMWPNLVRTPTLPREGVEGQLHYVGQGEFRDFNGKVIENNFVLMDFNTGTNWLNAAELGARAVYFIEPDWTVRDQAEEKFLQTPVDVPRFYIPKETASRLLQMMDNFQVVLQLYQ